MTISLFSALFLLAACGIVGTESLPDRPPHHVKSGFRNTDSDFSRPSTWTRWSFVTRRLLAGFFAPRSYTAPRVANDGAALRSGEINPSVTWIGHATFLLQLDGLNILTDPQWSDRASPVSWSGPRRLSPPGLVFKNLPRIDAVVISYDHYDHLTWVRSSGSPKRTIRFSSCPWVSKRGSPATA